MQYGAGLMEIGMPKMSEAEVDAFIKKSRDDDNISWDDIAKRLADKGYKSRRTHDRLTAMAVRYRYYNQMAAKAASSTTSYAIANQESGAERTLELVRAALSMRTDDKSKLALIEKLLDLK